jgi:hypothetical protein
MSALTHAEQIWLDDVFNPVAAELSKRDAAGWFARKYAWARDYVSAEDLLGEALTRLWVERDRHLGKGVSEFKAVVTGAAANIASDTVDKRERERKSERRSDALLDLSRSRDGDDFRALFTLREQVIAFPGVREHGWEQIAAKLVRSRKDSPILAVARAAIGGDTAGLLTLARSVVRREWWCEDRIAVGLVPPLSSVEAYRDIPFTSRREAAAYLATWLIAQGGTHVWCAARLIGFGILSHETPANRFAAAARLLNQLRPGAATTCLEKACPLASTPTRCATAVPENPVRDDALELDAEMLAAMAATGSYETREQGRNTKAPPVARLPVTLSEPYRVAAHGSATNSFDSATNTRRLVNA